MKSAAALILLGASVATATSGESSLRNAPAGFAASKMAVLQGCNDNDDFKLYYATGTCLTVDTTGYAGMPNRKDSKGNAIKSIKQDCSNDKVMSYTDNDCNEGEDEMDISEVECESGDAGIPIKCADAPAFDDDKKLGAAYYTEDKCSGTPVKADIDPTKCYKSSSAKGQADALVGLMYATQVVMASKFGGIDPTAGTYNAKLMTDCGNKMSAMATYEKDDCSGDAQYYFMASTDKCNELEGSSYNLACGSDGSPAPRATATIGLLLCAALAFFGIF